MVWVLLVGGLTVNDLAAADGRIPIYRPVTITQSGSYVLARDFVLTSTPLVTVQGNISVSIDLAGHTISGSGSEIFVLVQMDGSPSPTQCGSIRFSNGSVYKAIPLAEAPLSYCVWDMSVERMIFRNAPLALYEFALTLTSSRFFASSVTVSGDRAPGQVLIEGNTFDNGDITISGQRGIQIRHNVLATGTVFIFSAGIGPTARMFIEGNSVARIRINSSMFDFVYGAMILENTIDSELSLANTRGARVSGNLVGGSGIELSFTSDAIIESNNVRGGDYGIHFDQQSNRNTYRNNILRNAVVLDEGSGNIDAGGNITSP